MSLAKLALFSTAVSFSALAQKSEGERLDIMKHLRIEAHKKPATGASSPLQTDAGVTEPGVAEPEIKTTAGHASPIVVSFESVRPGLVRRCGSCHRAGGLASSTRWLLGDTARADFESTRAFIDVTAPTKSMLLLKGSGQGIHGGGKVISIDSPEYAALIHWAETGAPFATGVSPAPGPSARAVTLAPAPVASTKPAPAPTLVDAAVQAPVDVASGDAGVAFEQVSALLVEGCASCHAAGQMAGTSRYLASANAAAHFASLQPVLTILSARARGESHPGGSVFPAGSASLAKLDAWLNAGAPGPGAAAVPDTAVASVPVAPLAADPVKPALEAGFLWARLPVLGTFRLNGRFDLSLERTGYTSNPFSDKAATGLQSYHHFVFLSRESAEDPITLSAEITSLQFWSAGVRLSRGNWPLQLSANAGKLLVPFGGEPLYHHSYGGTAGFDQRVLLPVFAREGASVSAMARVHNIALTADAYVIAGYRLRSREAVLSLQSDLAPLDNLHLGLGARAGAAYGPLSIWYSAYFNPLGFGRRLFMQAADIALFRPKLKVLEYFSFGLGVLRADVSGGRAQGYGGPSEDYYHFASYFEVRAYPFEWLYVQYRQGLRTFNNRRGVFIDETRLTQEDSSTHNVGIVARWHGISCGLYQFWNLEKVNETPNDLTRLMVAYDF